FWVGEDSTIPNTRGIRNDVVEALKDKSGNIHISLCNLDPGNNAEVFCALEGAEPKEISGRVLTADAMTAHNTFDNPQAIHPVSFDDFESNGDILTVTLPSKSVVVLEIE
ncbi:MAG: alpha-L-arabinofuranosidase C-terminal domain-containing protein, partial [Sedimentisphaerales bacterium]